jgi:hypothetical protein
VGWEWAAWSKVIVWWRERVLAYNVGNQWRQHQCENTDQIDQRLIISE